MKTMTRAIAGFLLLILFIIPQIGCGKKGQEPASNTTFLLNTVCRVSLYEPADLELVNEALDLCQEYEKLLSRTISTSDVGRINSAQGGQVLVNPRTAEVISKGLEYGEVSGGLFDITVGELSDLWDFSGEDPRVPSAEALAACLPHIGWKNVSVGPFTIEEDAGAIGTEISVPVQLADPQAELDLGGVAKGYIGDRIAEFLREKGVKRAIIDLGGNIITIGEKEDGVPWNVAIEMPFSDRKEVVGGVSLSDATIVTSGIYERQFEENGVLYHHVLNPKTGYPRETDLEAVSIIGSSSADCDGLSTTCLMLGRQKAAELIESMPGYEAVFIDRDGKVSTTEGVHLNQ